jgi:hypothetical protein
VVNREKMKGKICMEDEGGGEDVFEGDLGWSSMLS